MSDNALVPSPAREQASWAAHSIMSQCCHCIIFHAAPQPIPAGEAMPLPRQASGSGKGPPPWRHVSRLSVDVTLMPFSHSGRGLSIRTTTYFSASTLNYGGLSIAADSWYNDHMSIESRINQAWIKLPEYIKAAVLTLVRSVRSKEHTP